MRISIIKTNLEIRPNIPELDFFLKNADANSLYQGLTATEAKPLKDYLHGKLSPIEAASEFAKDCDLEPLVNRFFRGHLDYLATMFRIQIKVVKLLVAIRNLRYHLKKGRHSKREMDLRNQTDLNHVLTEFAGSIADDQGPWCEVLALIRGSS